MKQGLPVIIVSRNPSNWGSCRIITPNIELAYQKIFGSRANYFNYPPNIKALDAWRLAKEIIASKPEKLVFIDHAPHPDVLLKAMDELLGGAPLPPIFVHVYGDFTIYIPRWQAIEGILKKTCIEFICASDRQLKLVAKMIRNPATITSKCHFPVDTSHYKVDFDLRKKWRQRLGAADDEHIMLYTGRLSMQKNILRLSDEFIHMRKKLKVKSRLLLAGAFDDLAAPFFGIRTPRGFYYLEWRDFMAKHQTDGNDCVEYIGNFNAEELRGLYNAADTYISLSLHHDEDYGMSPAEALCCGVPTILTDWGGYASFAGDPTSCRLIPVSIAKHGLRISLPAIRHSIRQRWLVQSSQAQLREERLERGDAYQKRLSVDAAVSLLKDIHSRRPANFGGFTRTMNKFAESFSDYAPFPKGPSRNTFYEEIYEAYVNPEARN